MALTGKQALQLSDVTFATAGTRRRTRPSISSASTARQFLQCLGWIAQTGRADPQKWYRRHLQGAVSVATGDISSAARTYLDLVASIVPGLAPDELLAMRARAINCYYRDRALAALMTRYPDWTPEIRMTGDIPGPRTDPDTRPIVFWADNTVFAPLIGRMAIHRAGFITTQFSDHVHGDSHTWLGKLTLQRMVFALENRYTAARIISGPATHTSAMRQLAQAARKGTPFFMNNNAFIGRRFACTRLNDQMSFIQSTAPMAMARHYDAQIVPVTVLETRPFEEFSAHFHPPLKADRSLARDDDIKQMAMLSTQRQLAEIRRSPEQWLCWTGGQLAQPCNGKLHRPAM